MSKSTAAFGLTLSLSVALLVGPWIGMSRAQDARDVKVEAPAEGDLKPSKSPSVPDTKETIEASELANDVKWLKTCINVISVLILSLTTSLGFALRETGCDHGTPLLRTLGRNLVICVSGMLGFWICGFALMCGGWGDIQP